MLHVGTLPKFASFRILLQECPKDTRLLGLLPSKPRRRFAEPLLAVGILWDRWFLYDPAGTFPKTGTGDFAENVTLQQYVNYQKSTGSTVQTAVLNTTPAQEAAIIQRAMNLGGRAPLTCANSVSGALGGACGIEGSIFPGRLNNQAQGAHCP